MAGAEILSDRKGLGLSLLISGLMLNMCYCYEN